MSTRDFLVTAGIGLCIASVILAFISRAAVYWYTTAEARRGFYRRVVRQFYRRLATGDASPRLTYVAYAPRAWPPDQPGTLLRCSRRVALEGGLPVSADTAFTSVVDLSRDETYATGARHALIAGCDEFCLPRSCEDRPGVVEDLRFARSIGLSVRFIEEE